MLATSFEEMDGRFSNGKFGIFYRKNYCIFFAKKINSYCNKKIKSPFFCFVLFYVCIRSMFTAVNSVNILSFQHLTIRL